MLLSPYISPSPSPTPRPCVPKSVLYVCFSTAALKINSSRACTLSSFSCVWLFVTQWTVAHQAPLSMGFSRQEYWSGLPFPPPGDLPTPGIEPMLLTSPGKKIPESRERTTGKKHIGKFPQGSYGTRNRSRSQPEFKCLVPWCIESLEDIASVVKIN